MRFRRLQYGLGFCLILLLFLLRTALSAPSSENPGQLETVAQRLHKSDPFSFVYTALDTAQGWRERIPSSLRLKDLVLKGYTAISHRLIGSPPVPETTPNTTMHGIELQPARLDRLDSYLRELFSWAM